MTYNEFLDKYNGRYVDFDGAWGPQCVDLVRQYILEVLNFPSSSIKPVVGAKDMYLKYSTLVDSSLYARIENTPTAIPLSGDIILWGNGEFGHVATFIEGDVASFRSFDQNFPVGSPCHVQSHTYTNVLGWLRPKTLPVQDELQTCINDRNAHWDKLIKISDKLGVPVQLDLILGEIDKLIRYEDIIRDKERELETKQGEVVELNTKINVLEKENDQLTVNIQTALAESEAMKKTVEEQSKRLVDLQGIVGLLEGRIDMLKQEIVDLLSKDIGSSSGWRIIWIGIKRLFRR